MICTVIWPSIAWTPRPCSSGISASGLLTPLQPRESSERIVAAIQYWHFRTLQCKILDIIGSCSYMLIHLKKFSSWLKFSLASIFLATAAAVRSFPFSFDFSSSAWYRSSSSACWESMTAFSSTRCFHCSSSWKNCNRHSAFKLTPTENYETRVGFMSKKKACTFATQMATPNSGLLLLYQACCSLLCFCFPSIHGILALNDLLRSI